MSDIVEDLRGRARGYRIGGPSAAHTAVMLETAADEIESLRAEVETWVRHAKTAIWSDSEECKLLTADNERLRAALERIAFGKYHWEADAQEEARAALETREAGVSSEVKHD